MTRKAFCTWWSSRFVETRRDKGLCRAARRQVEDLILASQPPTSVDRASLRPDVIQVLQIWEAIPPAKGSHEETKGKIRLLADMLYSGEYAKRVNRGEHLPFDHPDIRDARQWLHMKDDGTIGRYEPLRQVWTYKDVIWNSEKKTLEFMPEKPSCGCNPLDRDVSSILANPESSKISRARPSSS